MNLDIFETTTPSIEIDGQEVSCVNYELMLLNSSLISKNKYNLPDFDSIKYEFDEYEDDKFVYCVYNSTRIYKTVAVEKFYGLDCQITCYQKIETKISKHVSNLCGDNNYNPSKLSDWYEITIPKEIQQWLKNYGLCASERYIID